MSKLAASKTMIGLDVVVVAVRRCCCVVEAAGATAAVVVAVVVHSGPRELQSSPGSKVYK